MAGIAMKRCVEAVPPCNSFCAKSSGRYPFCDGKLVIGLGNPYEYVPDWITVQEAVD